MTQASDSACGPLAGLRVVEFAGLGPAPFCGMLLSDAGADIISVDRPGTPPPPPTAVIRRGRCHLSLNLKAPDAVATCLAIIERADVVIEGFRPGVMERLGLGPDVAMARNGALVYARMTGWGQAGPYSGLAGHDINYIAISGALHAIGPAERPVPPLNLVGDFGGGSLYLAFGILSAVLHARKTSQGQVVDCAISDGAASLMAMQYEYLAAGNWRDAREVNRLDGGAPFYGVYECADRRWISIGSIEPQFYAEFRQRLDLLDAIFDDPTDEAAWPEQKRRVAERVASHSQDHWRRVFEGSDACFAPVLAMADAPLDPHNVARRTFVERGGVVQPAPAPRFSATPGAIQSGGDAREALKAKWLSWGIDACCP